MRIAAFLVCVIGLSSIAFAQRDEVASASPEVVGERPAHDVIIGSSRERGGVTISESFDGIERLPFLPPPAAPLTLLPFAEGGYIERLDAAFGVVDNTAATSSPTYNGPAMGPDPLGERGGMLHVQRASIGWPPSTDGLAPQIYEFLHELVLPAGATPYFATMDIYRGKHEDFQWVRPLSYVEGSYLGGILVGGALDKDDFFAPYATRYGDPDVIEGAVVLGKGFGRGAPGAFYMNSKAISEDGWYTLGLLVSPSQISVWVSDAQTRGETSDPPSVTPMRTEGPFAGQRMFAEYGYGLESGWTQIYPGTEDDPATPGVVEGHGLALGTSPMLPDAFFDANGNFGAFLWAAFTLEAWRVHAGSDPPAVTHPEYEVRDWWIDNYQVRGGELFLGTCAADVVLDTVVDARDLAEVLAAWGGGAGRADINRDGAVDAGDLAVLLAAWGACP